MPALGRNKRNPKELRGVYNAERFVNEMNLVSNKPSGFIGTPIEDAEGFEKTIKSFEMIENYLEAYVPAVQRLIEEPERVTPPSASDLFVALTSAQRIASRISLNKLPLSDIELLQEYKAKMDAYIGSLTGFRDIMVAVNAGRPPNARLFYGVQTDLENIADRLSVLSQTITNQINVYNSGVSQPVKFGAGFNPKSPMYQTPEFVLPQRFL